MSERFDVIVVGGRCAGAPLAKLLVEAGMSVCVVDKASFPSDTPSTHGIQPAGVRILERIGLRERVEAVAAVVERGTIAFDDVRILVEGLTERVGAPMLNARRITLDAILLEAAAEAGADVHTGTAVTGLVEEGGRVAGVRTPAGELRAPLVVGADGTHSTVARLAGATDYHRIPCERIFMWAYFAGADAPEEMLWLGQVGDPGFLASHTDDNLFMLAAVPSADRRAEIRADREGVYGAAVSEWPELEACVAGAERVGPIRTMAGMSGFLRESAGPGWVLVGDAGHFKDPSPGQGISDALRQVVELAPAIERALGSAEDPDRVLRDWWAWRDRDAWEMYRFAAQMGRAGPTPVLLDQIQRRIASDERLVEGLLGVLNHDVAPSEVFTPALALRTAGSSVVRLSGRRRAVLRELRGLLADEVRGRREARAIATAA